MDKLSTELLNEIISYLDVDQYTSYVTISRRIQAIIEPLIFRSIKLKSTDSELDEFDKIFRRVGHRRNDIQHLKYDVVLPTYDDIACARFERKKDQDENSEVFSKAVHSLFKILQSWAPEEIGAGSGSRALDDPTGTGTGTGTQAASGTTGITALPVGRPIQFELGVYSPTDATHRPTYHTDSLACAEGKRKDLFSRRYEHSFLELLDDAEGLPTLSRITGFQLHSYGGIPRRIEGAAIASIARRFPNLTHINWKLNNDERKDLDIGRQVRYEFGESLKTLLLPKLKEFKLDINFNTPNNHHFQVPPYLHPSFPSIDHLSLGLCKLSQSPNLTHFVLSEPVVASSQLFWPADATKLKEEDLPFWPTLEYYELSLDRVTSFGEWWYELDPEEYDEAEHEHRVADHTSDNEDDDADAEGDNDDDNTTGPESTPDTWDEERESRIVGNLPYCSFRTILSREPIQTFLIALGRAVTRMPRIKSIDISVSGDEGVFEVSYQGPSAISKDGKDDDDDGDEDQAVHGKWEVTVGASEKWELSDEVRKVWESNGATVVVEEV